MPQSSILTFSALVVFLAGILTGCGPTDEAITPQTVAETKLQLSDGPIIGTLGRAGAHAWYGIPFAAAPVGPLRWAAPRPNKPWQDVFQATNFDHKCLQYSTILNPGIEPGQLIGSEDCLYLNVWAPAGRAENESLPVMFWIHGGANTMGYAGQYELGALAAKQNVIVVSLNYRLGPIGWFAHSALRESAKTLKDQSANFATLDLIAGLDWVNSNIQYFGGNASNVTIFGESAGGINVGTLIISPMAAGKFHQAIIQSGAIKAQTLQEAEYGPEDPKIRQGHASREAIAVLASQAPKNPDHMQAAELTAWLRQLPAKSVMQAYVQLQQLGGAEGDGSEGVKNVDVTRDGIVVPLEPIEQLFRSTANYNSVPIILGTNRDEVRVMGFMDEEMTSNISVVAYWPKDKTLYKQQGDFLSSLWRAYGVTKPANLFAAGGHNEVYSYRFDWDELGYTLFTDMSFMIGAVHAIEIPFVTGGFDDKATDPFGIYFSSSNEEPRLALSDSMMSYWAEFAYTGKPGTGRDHKLPEWKARSANHNDSIIFDTAADGGIRMGNDRRTVNEVMQDFDQSKNLSNENKCHMLNKAIEIFPMLHKDIAPYQNKRCPS